MTSVAPPRPAGEPEQPTPYLLVDPDVLDRNIADMATQARSNGLALRPHAKTHKSAAVALRQLAAGACGLTLATVAEAEALAAALPGPLDVFLAYPLWVDAARGRRLRELSARVTLSLGVDSATAAAAVAAEVPGAAVLVEVDSGQHRSGVAPEAAGQVATAARDAGLDVRGVFTFPGHSYAPGASADAAAQEARALACAVAALAEESVTARVVSGGSTPSVAEADPGVLTEVRPGVYVFGDAQQWELGIVDPARIALTCVATVVSHAGGQVVLDAGSKVLGADRAPYATGHGRLLDVPDARIHLLSEHHAVVAWPDRSLPALGSRLRVVPNHVCTAVNLADDLALADGGRWPVDARGANT